MPARLIQGTVLDAGGRPVPQARVYIVRAPTAVPDVAALSDDRGSFTLSVPQAGDYEVGAASDEQGSATAAVTVGQRAVPLQIRLPR